jgi:hypothetical protein
MPVSGESFALVSGVEGAPLLLPEAGAGLEVGFAAFEVVVFSGVEAGLFRGTLAGGGGVGVRGLDVLGFCGCGPADLLAAGFAWSDDDGAGAGVGWFLLRLAGSFGGAADTGTLASVSVNAATTDAMDCEMDRVAGMVF